MKPQPPANAVKAAPNGYEGPEGPSWFWTKESEVSPMFLPRGTAYWPNTLAGAKPICCPYGAPGDELWVREAWAVEDASKLKLPEYCGGENPDWIYYRDPVHIGTGLTWRSPIHMPRWASRITLRVTDIRVERVRAISEADAKAEGVETDEFLDRLDEVLSIAVEGCGPVIYPTLRTEFERRWDSINAKRGFSWESNPWAWVVSFEVAP